MSVDDVGAVADHGDEPQIAIGARYRTSVDEDDVGADREGLRGIRSASVRRRRATQRGEHGRRQVEIADAASDEIGRAEQPSGRGVRDRHNAVRTVREHPVTDAVEHRGLILHETGELFGLQAESEALESAPQHE